MRKWAVRRKHRIGPWPLCIRCLITGEWRDLKAWRAVPEDWREVL